MNAMPIQYSSVFIWDNLKMKIAMQQTRMIIEMTAPNKFNLPISIMKICYLIPYEIETVSPVDRLEFLKL